MAPIILPRISDQKPLVSVVSIIYNHEPYIRDCLEGFLMQKTNFPVEVIIHDDASTDHTADIIREYYEKRPDLFHVILERENQFSLHKPIVAPLYKMAQGKYIAICEGDDYWTDPLKLQKQFDFMEVHPNCSLCYHNVSEINETNKVLPHVMGSWGYKTGKEIYSVWTIPTCSAFFKRETTEEFIKNREIGKGFIYSDIVLFLSASSIGDVFGDSQTMAVYRRHENSMTTKQPKDFIVKYTNHHMTIANIFPDLEDESERIRSKFLYTTLIVSALKLKVNSFLSAVKLLSQIKKISNHFYGLKESIISLSTIVFSRLKSFAG